MSRVRFSTTYPHIRTETKVLHGNVRHKVAYSTAPMTRLTTWVPFRLYSIPLITENCGKRMAAVLEYLGPGNHMLPWDIIKSTYNYLNATTNETTTEQ